MKPTSAFYNAVKSGKILLVRIMMKDSLLVDPSFEVDLNEVIDNTIVKTGNALLEAYKQKIKSLADEIGSEDDEINFDPFEILKGDISDLGESFKDELKHTKRVEDGR